MGLLKAGELPKRVISAIEDVETFRLPGHTPPMVERAIAIDRGAAAGNQAMPRMYLHFSLSAAQQNDLNQLLQAQQNRRSPQYHKFLTPEEYAARFGVNGADIAKVTRWLEEQGFSDLRVARSQTFVGFSGTVARTEAAFHLSMHRYSLPGGTPLADYLANSGDPHLPKALQGLVLSLRGLHNFRMHPHLIRPHPRYTFGLSNSDYLTPDDWATIYDVKPLYAAGIDGTGVTIAVVGQSSVTMSDISTFRSLSGLSATLPTVLVPPGDRTPGIIKGDEAESDLDLEWSGGIAKNASILFVTSGDGVGSSIAYAIDNNVAPILSTSYGECEADETTADFSALNGLFQQAVAQGMTVLASAGDAGSTDCDAGLTETAASKGLAVDFPASSQYVTGIGGTSFNESAGISTVYWSATNNANNGSAQSYIPEIVWNDGFLSATGGGVSTLVTKPAWQTGTGVPNDGQRDVPDIALAASPNHDQFVICGDNWCTNGFRNSSNDLDLIGGTSFGPPTFAGVLALVIQQEGATTRLGNINPNLYSLAAVGTNIFNDVTSGSNDMACLTGTPGCTAGGSIGFSAGPGYDQTTGWGSINAFNFASQWYGDFQISASPNELTIQPGASATSTISVTPQNNFSGNVSLTCSVSSNLFGVTCSVPSTAVSSTGTATVTITAADNAHVRPLLKPFQPLPLTRFLPVLMLVASVSLFITWRKKRVLFLAIAVAAIGCGGGGSSSVGPAAPALTLSCSLANAMAGVAYSGSCAASGGTAPFTYFISAGTLPAGLTLNSSSGIITGTPTAPGTDSFTVKVTDSGSPQQSATQPETGLMVGAYALAISCSVPSGTSAGFQFNGSCAASGGTPPYTFSIADGIVADGNLPPGLTLDQSTGIVSGSALHDGIWYSRIEVVDSGSPQQTALSQQLTILVDEFSASGAHGGYAHVGSAFTIPVNASGGTPPYTFSLSSGVLPAGLTINSATGLISGTPTEAGFSLFAVSVSDSGSPQQSFIASCDLVVLPAYSETGTVTITAISGNITTTTTIAVTVP